MRISTNTIYDLGVASVQQQSYDAAQDTAAGCYWAPHSHTFG